MSSSSSTAQPEPVEFLLLGSGWTSQFLLPLLSSQQISHAYTSRSPSSSPNSIQFEFDPEAREEDQRAAFARLPKARTIVIIFPLRGEGPTKTLVRGYEGVHGPGGRWIQLGSTGIWDGGRSSSTASPAAEKPPPFRWINRNSPPNPTNPRFQAEQELLSLEKTEACVLNLAGLHGGARVVRNFLVKVAPTKEALAGKRSVHFVHGQDVARAVVLLHRDFTSGERWILTDTQVYDWWSLHRTLLSPISADDPARLWVPELMYEHGVRALPRSAEELGRALDGSAFWSRMREGPTVVRVD